MRAEFFARFGLYVERGFLDSADCRKLRTEMTSTSADAATVAVEGVEAIDDAYRRTKQARVSQATQSSLEQHLTALMPALAGHFGLKLSGLQRPQFLIYREGDYFRPHPDNSDRPDAARYVRDRRVSAVLFLNDNSEGPPEPDCYTGGALAFYGLMDEADQGASVGLPLEGEEGMLIAFPSDLIHAVQPVTGGERYTSVAWFYE